MKQDGLENVRGEPVMVTHWVRGAESAELVQPRPRSFAMLGLGRQRRDAGGRYHRPGPRRPRFRRAAARAAEAKGKIVLFNFPFTTMPPVAAYRRRCCRRRRGSAGSAASLALGRSVLRSLSPHTGGMGYDDTSRPPTFPRPRSPSKTRDAAADAGSRRASRRPAEDVRADAPDAPSRNVMAEIRGREKPTKSS